MSANLIYSYVKQKLHIKIKNRALVHKTCTAIPCPYTQIYATYNGIPVIKSHFERKIVPVFENKMS